METTFQELHINHTYAEWSKAVGEDITTPLVTGFVCSVCLMDTINHQHTYL